MELCGSECLVLLRLQGISKVVSLAQDDVVRTAFFQCLIRGGLQASHIQREHKQVSATYIDFRSVMQIRFISQRNT